MTDKYEQINILKQDGATSSTSYSHFTRSQKEVYVLAQALWAYYSEQLWVGSL